MERPAEEGWPAEFKADAADKAHVYQARGSQYISQSNWYVFGADGASNASLIRPGERGAALERTHKRANLLIQALQLTEAEWQARCAELEEEARRARAEGRAEALAEMEEQLRAAELRVMKAQEMMRDAVREREKAETLLTQAQQELALRRRAEERRAAERMRTGEVPSSAARLREEGEQFTEFLERAAAELGALRDDLRVLGDEAAVRGGTQPAQVIEGQWTRAGKADTPARATAVRSPAAPAPAQGTRREPVPGPPRRFLIALAWTVCAIPPWIPMLVVTANRAAYASGGSLWKTVPFTVVTVLLGAVAYLLGLLLAGVVTVEWLNRDSETAAVGLGCAMFGLGSAVLLLAAFWTPLTWPGPAGAWGKGLASFVGLG
ncbi:hypothetical protein [Streptomyces puniciscabiei]|uniref:hypothetical protein n=1 Tax=Streptomyces puniciscabiei TaxID=164348 RepID=UPI003794184F